MEYLDTSLVEQIEIRMIHPSRFPVRYDGSKHSADFTSLKKSIKEHGILQPILVRPLEHGFEIVAGHRRFSACKSLRWRFIPCKIQEFSDKHAYEIQLTENIQRRSMDPIEEAEAYQKYIVDYGWGGVSDLAKKIGKSEEYVSHRIQLLKLSNDIKEKLITHRLNISQAIELTSIKPSINNEFVDAIVGNKLTVRQIRKIKNSLSDDDESNQSKTMRKSNKTTSQQKQDLLQPTYKTNGRSKESIIIKKSTLALKITLSRIDDLIEESHKLGPKKRIELINYLMDQRRIIHSMIDQSIQYKNNNSSKT